MDGQEKIICSRCLQGAIHVNTIRGIDTALHFNIFNIWKYSHLNFNVIPILISCVIFERMETNLLLTNDMIFWFLPRYIILGQHTVHSHHVKSIGVFPACFQKPLLLQTMHSWTLKRIVVIFWNGPTWLPEFPETGRALLLPGNTDDAAGSRSSPGQIDRSCSPE